MYDLFCFQMSESVKVAVRCRPMSNKEIQQGCQVRNTALEKSRLFNHRQR